MNAKKALYYVLMLLPLAATMTALPFLPEQIPAHYNLNNQVDRWGSKLEVLILPAMVILFGFLMLGIARLVSAGEKSGKNNGNVCILAGLCCLIVFNALTGYFLYADFQQAESLNELPLDINQTIFALLGIIMIVAGNIMPKLRMNSLIGLRTSWSIKSEAVWKKCQRFGGISFILGGVLIVVFCLLNQGVACFSWSMGVFVVLLIVDVCYTYWVAKNH